MSSEIPNRMASVAMGGTVIETEPVVGKADEQDVVGRSTLSGRKMARYIRRSVLIWSCAVGMLVRTLALRRRFRGRGESDELSIARKKLAGRLRVNLIALGPTFIKLGQLLSTRVDVLPREVARSPTALCLVHLILRRRFGAA